MENKGHEVVETQLLKSQIAALEQLIEVYEKSVLEKTAELHDEISKRKQAEEAFRKSEERFRSMVESTSDWIWEIDRNGIYTYASPKVRDLLGYGPEEVIGRSPFDLMPPNEAKHMGRLFEEIIKSQKPFIGLENVNQHKNGKFIILETSGVPVFDAEGNLSGYRGIDRDITERRRAEELYKTLVERSIAAVFIVQDGKFRFINPSAIDYTGFSAEELIGNFADTAVCPEERKMVKEKGRAMLRGEYPTPYEFRIVTKQGELRWIMQAVFPIQFEGKQAILGNAIDITELKHAEEERRQSLEKLRQIMGAIIQAMAVSIETRDPYTAGHQRRVSDLARAIATEMGLSKEQIDGLRMASTIHDIGKISVPAEILSKPKRLNDMEFGLVKTHSQAGYDILKDIEFPWPIARIILEHHERMDGSGYPNGLTGNDLLIESQILAVADTVEAIASHRPYRPGLGINYALGEISNYKGILYDKEVVDACLRVFHEKGYKFET